MNNLRIPISRLIPQSGKMVLLDEALHGDSHSFTAKLRVKEDGLFNRGKEVPNLVTVEYMAQTIAAWAGYQAHLRDEAVTPGLLLGVRDYSSNVTNLFVDEALEVSVQRITQSAQGLAVFDCLVKNQRLAISARLTVLTMDSFESLNNMGKKI